MRKFWYVAVWLTLGFASAVCPIVEAAPRSVLVLDQGYVGSPWYDAYCSAFRSALSARAAEEIAINIEHLDFGHFNGDQYNEIVGAYLRGKYQKLQIELIVAVGPLALEFALGFRAGSGSSAPVVFSVVDDNTIRRLHPSEATGTILQYTLRDQIALARAFVPNLKHVAIVGDPLESQSFMGEFRRELPIFSTQLDIIDLTGLAMSELRMRVAELPKNSAIVYTAINIDGAGVQYIPRDALVAFAEVANSPIVVDAVTQIGYGGTGGFVASPTFLAEETALLALRILNGETASMIPVSIGQLKPMFDWRQLKRWNVAEHRLPPGSEIRFRDTTAWEQYSSQIVLVAAALLLQAGLIVGLTVERRRRRRAENSARQRMSELAHLNRVATASELATSIVHEVKQPLAAMVTNANAGLRWIGRATPDLEEARRAFNAIVEAGHRAADVIQSIRAMVKRGSSELAQVDVNQLIREVMVLLQGELLKSRAIVEAHLDERLPNVWGDRVQLQQVIMNLVMNAVEAMDSVSDRARVLRVRSEFHEAGSVLVAVEDSGSGIDPINANRVFEPLFTTKTNGMGMGLAICRSIIETHNGRLWAEKGIHQGSVFQFTLPIRGGGSQL